MSATRNDSAPSDTTLRVGTRNDLEALRRLLSDAQLTDDGLEEHLGRGAFVVALAAGRLVAAAGVEVHGPYGLLRSVVVDPKLRGSGIGARLMNERVAWSRDRGLRELYLLTETAADYFPRWGFRSIERVDAPQEIQGTNEFAELCPQSATVMRLVLDDSSQTES